MTNTEKKNGLFEDFYFSGNLKEQANYKNGKLDGEYKWLYKSGELMEQANYKNGKLDGEYKWLYEDGELFMSTVFKEDIELVDKRVIHWKHPITVGMIEAEKYCRDSFERVKQGLPPDWNAETVVTTEMLRFCGIFDLIWLVYWIIN